MAFLSLKAVMQTFKDWEGKTGEQEKWNDLDQ